MEWTGQQEQPVKMKHRVILRGAKMPNNFFVIILPQPPQGNFLDCLKDKDSIVGMTIFCAVFKGSSVNSK